MIVARHEYVFIACGLRCRPERVPEGQMTVWTANPAINRRMCLAQVILTAGHDNVCV
jgi:hypothetical protein